MEPYTTIVGQYVFVMLPGQCVDDYSEVEMTDAELNVFDAKFRKEQVVLQEASENQEWLDPCAYWRAREDYERLKVKGNPGKWRVRINSYKWIPTRSISPPGKPGQVYPASGLYPNDGSTTPLWTVEWEGSACPSRNGRHLVREGSWPNTYDDLAVAFYDSGKLIKKYAISELVRQPELLPHSVSHFFWCQESSFDDEAQTFTLRTLLDEIYVFDITSGAIINSEQIPIPDVTVEVEYTSGTVQTLSNFASCGPEAKSHQMQQGQSAFFTIHGVLEERDSSQQMVKVLTGILFQEIRTITCVGAILGGRICWHILLKNGEKLEMSISADRNQYCGKTLCGKTVSIPAKDVKKLSFREGKIEKGNGEYGLDVEEQ